MLSMQKPELNDNRLKDETDYEIEYFGLSDKGKELLSMLEPELNNNRLRKVIDYETKYEKKAFVNELSDKDNEISEKDDEIKKLKAILDQHDIDY